MKQLDRDTAERLLDGRVSPDDAPQGYALVARLIEVLRTPQLAPRSEHDVVTAAPPQGAAAPRAAASETRAGTGVRRRLTAVGLVLAATLMIGLTTAGALPGPIQGAAASVLERIGVHVPGGDDAPAPAVDTATTDVGANRAGAGTAGDVAGDVAGDANSRGTTASGEIDPATTGERNPNAATPAVPATPAAPADPGAPGDGATPAAPALPAAPAEPTTPTPPTTPTTPTAPTAPANPNTAEGRNG